MCISEVRSDNYLSLITGTREYLPYLRHIHSAEYRILNDLSASVIAKWNSFEAGLLRKLLAQQGLQDVEKSLYQRYDN
jgi:hypothetical protein